MYELGILGLTGMFIVVTVFLLSVNLRSNWHWSVKMSAIIFTGLFWVATYFTIASFAGLPSTADLPSEFMLVWSIEREPTKGPRGDPGVIYVWILPVPNEKEIFSQVVPRAYKLPYSRELHKKLIKVKMRIGNGERMRGKTKKRTGHTGSRYHRNMTELQFFTNKPAIPRK